MDFVHEKKTRLVKEIQRLAQAPNDIILLNIQKINNNLFFKFSNDHTVIISSSYPFTAPIIQNESGYYQDKSWCPSISLLKQFKSLHDNSDNFELLDNFDLQDNIKVLVIGRTLNQLINNTTKNDLHIESIYKLDILDIEENLLLSITDIIDNIVNNIFTKNILLNTIHITFFDPDNRDDPFIKSLLKYINKSFIINDINVNVNFILDNFRVNTVTDLDLVIIDWSTLKLLNNYDIGTTKYSFILELYLNLNMNASVYLFNTDYNSIFLNENLLDKSENPIMDKSGNPKKDARLKTIFEKLFESINTYCYIKNINNTNEYTCHILKKKKVSNVLLKNLYELHLEKAESYKIAKKEEPYILDLTSISKDSE